MKCNFVKKTAHTTILLLTFSFILTSCEREIGDDAVLATMPTTANIYTDNPIGLTDQFFESFDPASGANTVGFDVDNTVAYQGRSSIRIDVPAPNDPNGGYIGGIFRDRGLGRNLTGYDALTFWAKASTTAQLGSVGFGADFVQNKHQVTADNLPLSTKWVKYIIPIPDASKLTQERGLFLFSAGTQSTNGLGFTIWIDEIRFEKLGTVKLIQPYILNGANLTVDGFLGSTQVLNQSGATFNLANGQNITVNAAPSYFEFSSSDANLPQENRVVSNFALGNDGQVFTTVVGTTGSAVISAQLSNTLAAGSLTINAAGTFVNAPTPTVNPANVISIFSDTYSTIPGFNPGIFAGPNTASITAPINGGNQHINYQSIDFIGMGWTGTVDVSSKTMIHLHAKLVGAASSNLRVELIDFGPDGVDNGFGAGGGTAGGNNISSQLIQDQWVSINIPLNQFNLPTGGGGFGNPNRNNLGYIVLVSSNGASVLIDNIYFY